MYANVDLDDDGTVTLDEMLAFERDRLRENDDFIIAIYWVGYSVGEKLFSDNPKLENKFLEAGLFENTATDSNLHKKFEIDVCG